MLIHEYKVDNHYIAFVSPNLIEVMKCINYDYSDLSKCYTISFDTLWINHAISFPKSSEIAFVTEEKSQ